MESGNSMITVEHHGGFGSDTMKITFSKTGTRIKLDVNNVPNETISKLLELIKHQNVEQSMRSQFFGITSILNPNYIVKLFNTTKKHIANYNATKNTLEMVK